MTHRTMLEPIIVKGPAPITPLEAGMIALGDTSSKTTYLDPRVRERLFMHIRQLEEENEALRVESSAVKFNLEIMFNLDYESLEWDACYDRFIEYVDSGFDISTLLASQELDNE